MKAAIVALVERITFGRVRGQHPYYGSPSLRWWYTRWAWSHYFGASGWICLSPRWLWQKGREEATRRARMRADD